MVTTACKDDKVRLWGWPGSLPCFEKKINLACTYPRSDKKSKNTKHFELKEKRDRWRGEGEDGGKKKGRKVILPWTPFIKRHPFFQHTCSPKIHHHCSFHRKRSMYTDNYGTPKQGSFFFCHVRSKPLLLCTGYYAGKWSVADHHEDTILSAPD